MPFTFNFISDSEPVGQEAGKEKGGCVEWVEAMEVEYSDSHLASLSSLTAVEHWTDPATGGLVNFVSSDAVSKRLQAEGYTGDLLPALTSQTGAPTYIDNQSPALVTITLVKIRRGEVWTFFRRAKSQFIDIS